MQKFSIKQLICAAAVSGTCLSANAATIDLGLLSVGVEGNPFGGGAVPGAFQDIVKFTLPVNGGQGYSVVDFNPNIPGLDFKTLFSSMALFSNPDGVLFNGDDAQLPGASAISLDAGKSMKMKWDGSTDGGNMYLLIQGVATGTTGGLYSGNITVIPAPVPEPETWAMMLIGAGLVGFRLRTRSKKAAATRLV